MNNTTGENNVSITDPSAPVNSLFVFAPPIGNYDEIAAAGKVFADRATQKGRKAVKEYRENQSMESTIADIINRGTA